MSDIARLVHGNVIPMGNVPWDGTAHICISHETQNRMRASECY